LSTCGPPTFGGRRILLPRGGAPASVECMTLQAIEQATLPHGNFEGYLYGSEVSVIFERVAQDGTGPRLHRHPYSETFVIRSGRALFTVDGREFEAVGGQILVVQAMVPHKFRTLGADLYEAVHIHANDRFETEWLED
jgi:mannose-6-phosphate isomerase-like protein (cupin superfamily)